MTFTSFPLKIAAERLGVTRRRLIAQIAAGDVAEAVRTRDAFREAAAAARAVLDVLQAAEGRLLAAIAANPRDGLVKA